MEAGRSSPDGSGGGGGSDGGERRSSSSRSMSPPSPTERSKAEATEKPEEEEVAPAAAAPEEAAGKKPAPLRPPWAALISQSKQIPDVLIFSREFSVGGGETCNIILKDHNASRVLCKLWRLEPSGCVLQVRGKKGLVELNGSKISKGDIGYLEGGNEVAFCKNAYIFERYNEVPISASPTLPPSSSQIFKDGLKKGILAPDAIQFTLEDFPYYLSPNTKSELLASPLVHMEKKFIHMEKKLTKSLSGILLSGPSGSEIYQERLIMALAKNFDARLLIVDSLLLPVNELCKGSSGDQEVERLGIDQLIEVISEESISIPLIVFVKDAEKALTGRRESHASLGKELPPGVLIIGSHTEKDIPKDKSHSTGLSHLGLSTPSHALVGMLSGSSGNTLQARNQDATNSMKHLNNIFPNKISIELPKDEAQLSELKKQLRVDVENVRVNANSPNIHKTAGEEQEEAAKDEEHSSDEPRDSTRRYMPSISVRAWATKLGTAGERLQTCSTFLAGYYGPLAHICDFMRRVATIGPDSSLAGESPAALARIARACGDVGRFAGHVATVVEGVSGIGQMVGASFCNVARLYGPDVAPEPEPEPETEAKPEAASQPTKITVNTVEQARNVVQWTTGGTPGVEVDVGLEVTPAMAVNIYNEFRTAGSEALALISGGEIMMKKRAVYYTRRTA